jgi:polysaccharide export outer membrane protein
MTVVEAISLAGGFTPLAAKDDALLTRVQDGRLQRVKVPVKAIAEGGATNVFLRPGDIIFVPERIF